MNRRNALFAACIYVLLGHGVAHGHRETERFIPIGQSPGASGKTTRIGTVEGVDASARSFGLVTPEGRYRVQVPAGVPIWLDRSRNKQKAMSGSFGDLRAGRRAEVKYEDAERAKRAVWIKVEVAE